MKLCSSLVLVALLSAPAVARAGADGLDHIDFNVEAVARVELPQLSAILERVGSWNVANGVAIGFGKTVLERLLGFDATSMAAWKKLGIDTREPVWISLALDHSALEDRYARLLRNDDWSVKRMARSPPAFWRLRLVFGVTDGSAATTWIKSATGATWKKLPGRLRHGSSRAFGHWKAGNVWFFVDSPRPDQLVLDIVRPAFAHAGAPPPLATIVGAARPVSRSDRFGALKGARAARALRDPGLSLWLRTRTIFVIGRSLARENHVSEVAGRPRLRAAGPLESHPSCMELARVGQVGPFEDLAIRLHADVGGNLVAEASFGGDAPLLAKTFARADHHLDAHRRAKTVAWVSIWNRGPAGVRALPRNRSFQSWPEALRLLRQCAPQHALPARIFGWPELSGLFFDELAALGPRGKAIAGKVAGASGSIAHWADDPMQMTATLEGTLDDTLAPMVESSLTSVFGDSRATGNGRRWGRGRMRPYVRNGRVGTTLGGDAGVRWLERSKLAAPVVWLSGHELAAAWVDLARSGSALSRWEPRFTALEGAGELRVRLFVTGDRVVLESKITRK